MAKKDKTVSTATTEVAEEEVYPLVYKIRDVHFNNCTITQLIMQTGKPGEGDPPPGTGG